MASGSACLLGPRGGKLPGKFGTIFLSWSENKDVIIILLLRTGVNIANLGHLAYVVLCLSFSAYVVDVYVDDVCAFHSVVRAVYRLGPLSAEEGSGCLRPTCLFKPLER